MAVEVVDLTSADIPGAIEVIQQAFADDPYFKWVFDSSKVSGPFPTHTKTQTNLHPRTVWGLVAGVSAKQFNKQRNYDSLSARCNWGIKNALFQVAKESEDGPILGVSCWLAPRPSIQPESWYSWFQAWNLSFHQLLNNIRYLGRGGLRTNRYWIWKERQAEAQAAVWDDLRGYYFCNIVAVSPEAQGKGVGRLLFEAVTKKADAEGVKCYLESSKSVPNVMIYERMGFEMRKKMECRDGEDACMLYCMVRDPKQGVSTLGS